MGTYVDASVRYGVIITDPEIDWENYVEPDEDAEEIDYWDLIREEFPLLDYIYAGDSNWDDNPDIIFVKDLGLSVGEESVAPLDLYTDLLPSNAALTQLRDLCQRLGDKEISEPGWLLLWNRG